MSQPAVSVRAKDPIPLNAAQESEVRDLYYKRVRALCSEEIREFAQCATGRTFSVAWACRPQRFAMERCMVAKATRDEEDKAREEWFALLPVRAQEKEKEELWKEDQRRMKKEWWADYVAQKQGTGTRTGTGTERPGG